MAGVPPASAAEVNQDLALRPVGPAADLILILNVWNQDLANIHRHPRLDSCPFHLFHRIMPAKLCKGMRMSAASTSPQRGIDRIRAGVVRPRGVRNGDADRRPWARKRPFRTRPAERVDHPVCPCRATGVSLNRDNSRGMSQECAANAVR